MMVRHATIDDLGTIAKIHIQAFDGFFLTHLGHAFLREYYGTVSQYPAGIMLVATVKGQMAGFAGGFMDPSRFYRYLRTRRLQLAIAALPALLRRPGLFPRLLGKARAVNRHGLIRESSGESELASIAVAPSAQGRGIGVGLVQSFASRSRALGADRVLLSTDAEGNDAVNRFYHSLGFQISETFHAPPSRRMHRYELILDLAVEGARREKAA